MVVRSIEHLRSLLTGDMRNYSPALQSFISGSLYREKLGENTLCAYARFANGAELRSVSFAELERQVAELEVHLDINLTYTKVTFFADLGSGPTEPLQVYQRRTYTRAISLRLEESEQVNASIAGGELIWPERSYMAQVHYSTGMTLMAGEDSVPGLMDGAFMQFYLSLECMLGVHKQDEVRRAGASRFGGDYPEQLASTAEHVYLARHRFFGHGHAKYEDKLWDDDRAFAVAKQVLVARWCARAHIAKALGRPLVHRTMPLYFRGGSAAFSGEIADLENKFALP